MTTGFFKFPSTPHLASLGGNLFRDDKVFIPSERDEFLCHEIIVEEKIDGANLGISFDGDGALRLQNRGEYICPSFNGQWKKLNEWLPVHTDLLFDMLTDRYMLFGEWCYARHTVHYNSLPDWFMAFDIYDRINFMFLSVAERNRLVERMGITSVPEIARGRFNLAELTSLLSDSKIGDTPAEGIYLRLERNNCLESRAKLVRPEFVQSIERHWSKSGIETNSLRRGSIW